MDPAVFRSLVLILASVVLWFMGYNAVTTHFQVCPRELGHGGRQLCHGADGGPGGGRS